MSADNGISCYKPGLIDIPVWGTECPEIVPLCIFEGNTDICKPTGPASEPLIQDSNCSAHETSHKCYLSFNISDLSIKRQKFI